jgi:hypothetical protein
MKIAAFVLVLIVSSVSAASADSWTVNSTLDRVDLTPGDGICSTGFTIGGAPECTLRAAVQEANARRFAIRRVHQIYLPAGVYLLTLPPNDIEEEQQRFGTATSALAVQTGDLDINIDLGITGVGEGLTIIDGGSHDRVFDVWSQFPRIVGFQDLTVRRGATTGPGGCIRHRGGSTQVNVYDTTVEGCVSHNQVGGGMLSEGYTEIRNATFRNNSAARGAGFENGAVAFIWDSTFDHNTARPSTFSLAEGGGISNISLHGSAPWMVVRGTTISNNFANVGAGVLNRGSVRLINSTVSGNQGDGLTLLQAGSVAGRGTEGFDLLYTTVTNNQGNGLRRLLEGGVGIQHSIFAGNGTTFGANCEGGSGYAFGGYNLEDRNDCGFVGEGDVTGVDPLIGPLAANGGPTLTHALLPGSPAIDAGLPRGRAAEVRDQRGTPRPLGASTDIGAFEYGIDPAALTILVPIPWEWLFEGTLTGTVEFSTRFTLSLPAGSGRDAGRMVGVRAANGQPVAYELGKRGRSLTAKGLAVPPKPGDQNRPPLFYLEVQRSLERKLRLEVSKVVCKCDAKPAKAKPIVIQPYTPKGK